MDTINHQSPTTAPLSQHNVRKLLHNTWVRVGAALTLALLLILPFLSAGTPPEMQPVDPNTTPGASTPPPSPTVTPFSPEQLRVIEEQRQSDVAVGDREIEIKTAYPWFIKLPLRGEKYFVYFDRSKKTFIGLLYPKAGDDLAPIKAEIMQKLADVYSVPTQDYAFEWRVTIK